jgi:hypothetical protein
VQDRVLTRIMNAGVLLHCVIAYQIDLNVACHTLLALLHPAALDTEPRGLKIYAAVYKAVEIG